MAHTYTWDNTFENLPANSDQVSVGASRITDLKKAISERLTYDHSMDEDDNDGYHKWVTLLEQGSVPSTPASGSGLVFGEEVADTTGYSAIDDAGLVSQIDQGFEVLSGSSNHTLDKSSATTVVITPDAERTITLPKTGVRGGRIVRIINLDTTYKIVVKSFDATQLMAFLNGHVVYMANQNTPTGSTHWTELSAKGGAQPAFHVYRSGQQNITTINPTKIVFNAEEFDTNENFASNRFTPTVPGPYDFKCGLRYTNFTNNESLYLHLYKNGSTIRRAQGVHPFSGNSIYVSWVAEANGTDDYFELFADSAADSNYFLEAGNDTFFAGVRAA